MSFIVAIDGPAGSGKGTITKIICEKLNLINISTGGAYRSVALATLQNNIQINEIEKIVDLLDKINIEFKRENNKDLVYLNGKDVTRRIREKDVTNIVSKVSSIEERAKRRVKQNEELGIHIPYEEIKEDIRKRDENDKNKEIGALKKADDSIYIDTSNMTIEEVTNEIIDIIKNKMT